MVKIIANFFFNNPTYAYHLKYTFYVLVNNLDDTPLKTYIIYINPLSGRGKSMDIFNNNVKPMFAEAEIEYEVIKTGKILCHCFKIL